jgi:hypothetical protein
VLALAAAMLAGAGTANAAGSYYASPTGSGPACSDPVPCDIYQAVSEAQTDAGSSVLLKPGSFTLSAGAGGSLQLNGPFSVLPAVAGTRPEITSTDGSAVSIFHAGVTIQDLRINIGGLSSAGRALDFQVGGKALRVEVVAAGPGPVGVLVKNGATLSDSTVWVPSDNGTGIVAGIAGGTVRNVTEIATGANSIGFGANGNFGRPQTTTLQNSILRGALTDLYADHGTGPGDVAINVENSDFVSTDPHPPNSVINNLGGNIASTPGFVNPAGGNFRQLAGSPTIDVGKVVTGLSGTALDGQARIIGPLPDIGADEFQPPPSPAAPGGAPPPGPLAAPVKKCKKKKHSRTAVTAKKKCKKKKS